MKSCYASLRKMRKGTANPSPEASRSRNFIDAQAGVCAIYISVLPSHAEFYLLLAHEIGHLQRPSLVDDWEMEGFCMVLSEDLCRQQGKDWSLWERRFREDSKDPYARAYRSALQKK
jgi:hypothetical protein